MSILYSSNKIISNSKTGEFLRFDGVNDALLSDTSFIHPSPTSNFTLFLKFITFSTADQYIFSTLNLGGSGLTFGYFGNTISLGTSNTALIRWNETLTPNQVTTLQLTYDISQTGGNRFSLYKNSNLITPRISNTVSLSWSNTRFAVGRTFVNTTSFLRPFNGVLFEVSIVPYLKSTIELNQDYLVGSQSSVSTYRLKLQPYFPDVITTLNSTTSFNETGQGVPVNILNKPPLLSLGIDTYNFSIGAKKLLIN